MDIKYDENTEGTWQFILEINDKIEIKNIDLIINYNDTNNLINNLSILNSNNERNNNRFIPYFFAKIDFELSKVSKYNIETSDDIETSEININGMKFVMKTKNEIPYKLTKLIFFLNPEGPRKILKRNKIKGNPKNDNFIDLAVIKGNRIEENMEYSNIEICLKFENPGNYYIIVKSIILYSKNFDKERLIARNLFPVLFDLYDQIIWFRFPIKVKEANKEKCVTKLFWKIDGKEKTLIQNLRKFISIVVTKESKTELEDDKMTFHNESLLIKYPNYEFVAAIYPSISEGVYEFYTDEDGITKEKEKMNEAENNIFNFYKNKEENPNKKRKLF
uniref:Uncharacterized protein n=1 Tax=Meloidogyne hapla TaxID=6305 RepID=A0A1I8BQI6_MELHA